ncbi:hypothetical protein LZ32DRAFT_448327 [Colletotrichum eremochloae]|nr:hypothetical protein LZ32DRAFT_448327 [Colletotrichum eremochloae]
MYPFVRSVSVCRCKLAPSQQHPSPSPIPCPYHTTPKIHIFRSSSSDQRIHARPSHFCSSSNPAPASSTLPTDFNLDLDLDHPIPSLFSHPAVLPIPITISHPRADRPDLRTDEIPRYFGTPPPSTNERSLCAKLFPTPVLQLDLIRPATSFRQMSRL